MSQQVEMSEVSDAASQKVEDWREFIDWTECRTQEIDWHVDDAKHGWQFERNHEEDEDGKDIWQQFFNNPCHLFSTEEGFLQIMGMIKKYKELKMSQSFKKELGPKNMMFILHYEAARNSMFNCFMMLREKDFEK